MTVWRMKLRDYRNSPNCNADKELKFRICIEKSILAIGWGMNADFDNWAEYRKIADWYYSDDNGYPTAVNHLSEMKRDDLVWIKNPVTDESYIAQIIDDAPSLCCYLKEFDIYGYRKAKTFKITPDLLEKYNIPNKKGKGHTIEHVRIQSVIDGTIKLFDSIK